MVIARRHMMGALAALFELAATAARGQTPQAVSSRPVFKHDLPNITLDNWEVTVSHVDYPPGYIGKPHQHRGILCAYVLEGTVVSQIHGEGVPPEERTYRVPGRCSTSRLARHIRWRRTRATPVRRACLYSISPRKCGRNGSTPQPSIAFGGE